MIAHWFNATTNEHVKRSHSLTHLYDELGNRIETTLPDGRKLKTMYYGSGHAWNYALEDSHGIHEISSLERDDLHQEISRTQGQLASQFRLDTMGRLIEQQVHDERGRQEKRIERLYHYDKAGQLKEILDKRFVSQDHVWQRTQNYHYDVLSRLTASELSTLGKSENYIQMRERFAFDPASNILPIANQNQDNAVQDKNNKIEDNRVRHIEQEHQTVHYQYDDLGRIIHKQIHIKDKQAFGHIRQQLSQQHVLNQFTSRQIELQWDEQNQLQSSTSVKPDGRGGQDVIHTQYCYDPFGRRIAKQSQVYKKTFFQKAPSHSQSYGNQLTAAPKKHEQLQRVHVYAIWSVWDGNRILQDHHGQHVFTTVYEADSFVPLARLLWLQDCLTVAANDATPQVDAEQFEELKQVAFKQLDGFESLNTQDLQFKIAANDAPSAQHPHQVYWYQNDHLGTPKELTSNAGNIEWEAVYQAWGNTVTVEWQEVAKAQDFEAIELNELEKAYLLQPHRFQGQIYDVETGLHYNRFRYYDPDAGRFISHDPIGLLGGDNHFQYAPNPVEWIDPWGLIRVRHYTNRRGSNGIRDSGVIKAQDNNRIYVEPATKKPLSQVDAESKYQLKQGKGRDYIEFDVPDSKTEWVRNPRYHTDELTIKGDFELDSSCNLTITQRK